MPQNNLSLNRKVAFYLVKLDGKRFIYVVHCHTSFRNAVFIRGKTSLEQWALFIESGPPFNRAIEIFFAHGTHVCTRG